MISCHILPPPISLAADDMLMISCRFDDAHDAAFAALLMPHAI